MSAALIAAVMTTLTAPAVAVTTTEPALGARAGPPSSLPNLDRNGIPGSCRTLTQKTADSMGAKFKRLDELPWGLIEHAVLRSVGGCPVREVVYQGQTFWVEAPQGQLDRANPMGERLQKHR